MKQKRLLVEDYAQQFLDLNGRLAPNERPTNEMLGEYFYNGLRESLRIVVASIDILRGVGGFNQLVAVARRAEKRLGTTRKKKKYSSDSDSELESDYGKLNTCGH